MLENSGLTDRAIAMLSSKPRSLVDQVTDEAEIKSMLLKEGCPTSHKIVEFQMKFAGYIYTRKGGSKVRLGMTKNPLICQEDNHWFCEFAHFEPNDAPADLVMDEQGKVYWEENPVPLAASIEVFIESASIVVWFRERTDFNNILGGENVFEIEPEQVVNLHTSLTGMGLEIVKEATDAYQQWWFGQDIAVNAYKVWSSDGSRVGVNGYISSPERRQQFVKLLHELNIIPLRRPKS